MATEKKDETVNKPTQSEPYPTGNPPDVDMMKEAHPQIVLEQERAVEAEAAKAKEKPEKEDKPEKAEKPDKVEAEPKGRK